jgi:DNA mismatch endonuclease (patch repair protein)
MHNCPYFVWPISNESFWRDKIEGNVSRDIKNQTKLLENGWTFLLIWECALRKIQKTGGEDNLREVSSSLREFLDDESCGPMEFDTSGLHVIINSSGSLLNNSLST